MDSRIKIVSIFARGVKMSLWRTKIKADLIMLKLDLKALMKKVDVYDALIYSYMAFCIYIVVVSV